MKSETRNVAGYTGFKRDVLCAIAVLGGTPDAATAERPYGLAVKRQLEDWYGVEVNHGRLYPNLDDLVDDGYAKVGEQDKRTNGYALTVEGVTALRAFRDDVTRPAYDQIDGGTDE